MKTQRTIHILLAISGLALAAAPGHAQTGGPLAIIWQATYGPGVSGVVGYALPGDFVQTPDGGFVIAGYAEGPVNGIRTEPICGMSDYWIVKIDAQGQRQWDRSYGGDSALISGDLAFRIFLRADGGFDVAGLTFSPPGCLKTAPLHGAADFWLVRCDAAGAALWDKSYIPRDFSFLYLVDCDPTADGGYLACGAGDPGQKLRYWGVIKLDAQGQQLWSKSFGCSSAILSSTGGPRPVRVRETSDGGFVVAGAYGYGGSSCGDKTSPYYGGDDGWRGSDVCVVRFEAQQNKLWDKTYGGVGAELAVDIAPTPDGGFMIFGSSASPKAANPNSGTKTSLNNGMMDFWVIRIDAHGNQLWDKSYGGAADDVCTHAEPMPDGGWLLSGYSRSLPKPAGGKTAPAFGMEDLWILRIDDQGNRLWDQSFGGSGAEGIAWRRNPPWLDRTRIKRIADGGFLLTGYSESPVSGLKTAPLISHGDFWVLKLGPEPPSLRGEMTAEGKFQLRLIGPPEFQHLIQGSSDLVAWTDLVTVDNPTGKAFWTDPDSAGHRFYRAVRK